MPGKQNLRDTEGHGGRRPGAGRPKETLSVTQLKEMLDKAKEFAEKHDGKTVDDFLLMIIYGDKDGFGEEKIPLKDRLAAIKLWKDKTMIQVSEGGDSDKELGPTIYLPEEKPDPAKVVDIDSARDLDTP